MMRRLLYTIVASTFMSTGVLAMQDNMLISCQVSDPRNVLPVNFDKSLCSKLAADLDMDAISSDLTSSQGNKKIMLVSLEAMSLNQAQYSVSVRNQGSSGEPVGTFGPFIVETMDATLETALPDHLKNDLKRLLDL